MHGGVAHGGVVHGGVAHRGVVHGGVALRGVVYTNQRVARTPLSVNISSFNGL